MFNPLSNWKDRTSCDIVLLVITGRGRVNVKKQELATEQIVSTLAFLRMRKFGSLSTGLFYLVQVIDSMSACLSGKSVCR